MSRLRHLLAVVFLPVTGLAQATLYWDVNGATAGIGTAGGTWNTTNINWSSALAGDVATDVWLNDGTAKPVFMPSAASYTVTIGNGLQAHGMGFNFANAPETTLTLTGLGTLALTNGTIDVSGTGIVALNHALSSAVGLTLNGGSSNVLSLGNSNPALAGITTVAEGTLVFNSAGALGPETAGNGIVIGNGELRFDGDGGDFSYTVNDAIAVNGTGRLTIDYSHAATRAVVLGGPMTLNADARIIGGTLHDLGVAKIEASGVISGAGRNVLVEGDVVLTGANSFTGRVIAGPAQLVTDDTGRVTIPTFNDDGIAGPLGAGTGLKLGEDDGEGGTVGEVFYTGATASSNRTIQVEGEWGVIGVVNAGTTLTLTGVISGSGGTAYHDLEKTGPGTLVLTGDNTYDGDTYVTNGDLVVGHNHALGPNGYYRTVEVGTYDTGSEDDVGLFLKPGVTLGLYVDVYNDNYYGNTTLGLMGAGTATFAEEVYIQRDVDVRVEAGGALHFASFFSDGGGGGEIRKTGAGTAVFSGGIDLRGGGIAVEEGGLQLGDQVIVDGSINVASGAVLSGTAAIDTSGMVVVVGGGRLSPGNSPGTLTVDELYLASGSDLLWELGGLSTTDVELFDRVVITDPGEDTEIYQTATLTIDLSLLAISLRPGNTDPLLNDAFWRVEQTWTVVDFTIPFLGRADNLAPGAANPMTLNNAVWAGGTFSTLMGANGDLLLRFTPVPEPATWALGGLGGLLLVAARFRRKR